MTPLLPGDGWRGIFEGADMKQPKTTNKEPTKTYEVTGGFNHNGTYRRNGEPIELTATEAAELKAVNFVRDMQADQVNGNYMRRDMRSK
jgi:hypothetical protein